VDKFVINGGKFLSGTITIGGAKNASLALMPATILQAALLFFPTRQTCAM
jgi:UDP-N-acetylglucosamine 1-carboxyvinyltransferase